MINVLTKQIVFGLRSVLLFFFLNLFFGGHVFVREFIWDSVDRQILVLGLEVNKLYRVYYFLSFVFAPEQVIILVIHMYDELIVTFLSANSHTFDLIKGYATLDLGPIFDVVNPFICDHDNAKIIKEQLVNFVHDARKNDGFYTFKLRSHSHL